MRTAWVKNALSGLLASLLTWASLVQSSTLETELLALKEAVQVSRIEQDNETNKPDKAFLTQTFLIAVVRPRPD